MEKEKMWVDPETGIVYKDKGIIQPEFSKKSKNIPFKKSLIYETTLSEGYLTMLMDGAYIHGFLLDDNKKTVCGHLIIETSSPSGAWSEKIWEGVTCNLFSSVLLNLKIKIKPGYRICVFLLSPNVINPDKSIINLGIRIFEKIRMR